MIVQALHGAFRVSEMTAQALHGAFGVSEMITQALLSDFGVFYPDYSRTRGVKKDPGHRADCVVARDHGVVLPISSLSYV